MLDSAFMVIRVGKHRERIRVADYKPGKWPDGHEILSGLPPIPAEMAQGAEISPADGDEGAAGGNDAADHAGASGGPEIDNLAALKAKADELGVPYAANIGAKTLAARIEEAEAYISGEQE